MVESSVLRIPNEDLQKYIEINEICILSMAKQQKVGLLTIA